MCVRVPAFSFVAGDATNEASLRPRSIAMKKEQTTGRIACRTGSTTARKFLVKVSR